MDFDFFMPARVISGKNALLNNGDALASLGKRCLLVTGGKSAKVSGALDDAVSALVKQGIVYDIYDKIGPNPLISACHEAGEKARAFGADFILGIGGGSPLDAAKAVAVYAANEDLEPANIFLQKPKNPPLPLALVGTTAGTGSEVTGVSVLTVDETGRKRSITGPNCYAKISFADPKYTYSVPYATTVSTALDAFSHALESFFTPKAVGLTKCVAQKALEVLWPALLYLEKNESSVQEDVSDKLYYGSLYAGLAINTTGTAFPHPLGYILTENYDVPHGKACAVFMPAFLERAKLYKNELYKELFEVLQTDKERLVKTVKKLLVMPGFGLSAEEAEKYSARWFEEVPQNFLSSPGGLTQAEARAILGSIYL
ncbi:MAG TPA: iron-containing alcohol dehydrogenase [Clostridiales bacterium]|mgnify:CR=1 FL=1|nr:iron-containing alcohol dehydrogenase [Clostridiales bacterium]